MNAFRWIGLVLLLFFPPVASRVGADDLKGKASPKPARTLTMAERDQLKRMVERPVKDKKVPGVSLLVWSEGETVFQGSAGNLKADQKVQVASSSKPITATLFMMLVDEGKLALDDPVEKYVPEMAKIRLKDGKAPKTKMTLRHVLTNTSGLPGDFASGGGVPPLFVSSLAESARGLAKSELQSEPGEMFRYCTMGFNLAARAIEIVAEKPFDVVAQERLFNPLGMTQTEYVKMGLNGPRPANQARYLLAGGGMMSTLQDLARFYEFHLNDGVHQGKRLLSSRAVVQMRTRQTALSDDLTGSMGDSYGIAFFLGRRDATGKHQGVSHAGVFGSVPWVDVDHRLIGVVFVQGRFQDIFSVAFGIQREVRSVFGY